MKEKAVKENKLLLTEALNDLHRNGFLSQGKAEVLLHAWGPALREEARCHFPASRLRKVHADTCGKENW